MHHYLLKQGGEITYMKKIPAIPPTYSDFYGLKTEIISALRQNQIEQLYSHQSKAVKLALENQSFVIVTPTASGKTLCYNLPVLNKILSEKETRALYLFPTKALANDQLTELKDFIKKIGRDIKCSTYDGDTTNKQRKYARDFANVIISNPDMLNSAILPHHSSWSNFFRNLKFIVIDELHSYRGVFGTHLANLLLRLQRICDFYEVKPIFICCSATIANPIEHAENITNIKMKLISENGAPSPEKKIIVYNPPLADKRSNIRFSSLLMTSKIAANCISSGINSIVFTRSRLNVELLLRQTKEELLKKGEDTSKVAGYRAGYLPAERRAIERDLRSGKLCGVISTNALELGIDIGSLDLTILHGYPGSVASTWQQIGRAGRSSNLSSAILIPTSSSSDQFIAYNPNWVFDVNSEMPRINVKNIYIMIDHIVSSAFELPFSEGERFGDTAIIEILNRLVKHEILYKKNERGCVKYYTNANLYPAKKITLRSSVSRGYTIFDITDPNKKRVVGFIDKHNAPTTVFPGAVYFHENKNYLVKKLDRENLSCFVERRETNYYTEAAYTHHINIDKQVKREDPFGLAEVTLLTRPYLYKRIELATRKYLGWGKIDLPDVSFKTTAAWITIPETSIENSIAKIGLEGVKKLLRNCVPLLLMCHSQDILVHCNFMEPNLGQPTLFIADNIPGGVGLADGVFEQKEKLLEMSLDSLSSCPCTKGCPACVGTICGEINCKQTARSIILKILNINCRYN